MASKGQKFNKYSDELKYEIVLKYINGKGTSRSLSHEYGISYRTIETMIYTYKHRGHLNKQKRGRVKESDIDYKERYEILKKYQAFLKAQRERKWHL